MENIENYMTSAKENRIEAHMINIIITDRNKARLHEIIRELLKLGAIEKMDAEGLMACCEVVY